ncbi:MAG TPA: choice-of-anchor A family protein [Acetobacteraceae bacterium]|nr:choice-of-anchor A family protein [Acetobacteraceae bacterium]
MCRLPLAGAAPACSLACAVLLSAGAARADAVSAQQLSLLQQFNLIDLGNLQASSDIEGRAFVAGNMSGNGFSMGVAGKVTASPAGYNTLIVDGSATTGGINIGTGGFTVGGNANSLEANSAAGAVSTVAGNVTGNTAVNGGTLHYGGSFSGNFNGSGSKTQVTGLSSDPLPASTFAPLQGLSATLAGLAPSGTVSMVSGTATFVAAPGASGYAVFDVDAGVASQIFDANGFAFDLGTATSAIINVSGADTITDMTNFNDSSLAPSLLWNFIGTTTLDLDREFNGTILADDATVTNETQINGTLLAANANLDGELHSTPYAGGLPDGGSSQPVPEPADGAVLGIGLLGLVAVRRGRSGR